MRFVLIVGWMAAAATAVGAEWEENVDRPYRLTVCLRFSDDPVLTRFFTASVRRQVKDRLTHNFGSLAAVEVVGRHALLDEVDGAGLAGLAVLPHDLDPRDLPDKLFLASVDYRAGLYTIAWRQWDGDVQQMGPLGHETTPDRQWLGKAVCLAVTESFAPVALVDPIEATGQVRLRFRGADRGPRLAACLEDGCVLQPFWVIRQRGGTLARIPIPYTVLRIDDAETPGRATVVSSLADPWRRTARVAGFQAIKIRTQRGRFRLRLVDARDGSPVQTCQVYAGSTGFDSLGDADRLEPPDRDGYVVAPRPLEHLAYIKITQSGGAVSRILLPVTGDWCEQVCRLRVDEQAREKDRWQRQITVVVQDVQVLQNMLDQSVRDLNRLNQEKQYEQALKQVREAIGTLDPLLNTAGDDVAGLQQRAGKLGLAANQRLRWTSEQLETLVGRMGDLGEMAERLEETIRETVARNLAVVQARLAENLLQQGSIEEAIARYEEAVQLSPQPAFRQRLDALKQTWRIKDDAHRAARAFVFQAWKASQIRKLDETLPEAENAFRKLRQVDDYLTARALLQGTGEHLRELADLVDMLSQRDDEADRATCRQYIELTEQMARFQLQVGEYLKGRLAQPADAPAQPEPSPD